MDKSESLSAEDLRLRLFESFRGKGLLDSLKSQLRSRLVSLLHESQPLSPASHDRNLSNQQGNTLADKVANSLVVDHLQRCGYEYTMAIFLPESGTKLDEVFVGGDLLKLLCIKPDSEVYHKIEGLATSESKGFLWQLLSELTQKHSTTHSDTATQTFDDSSKETATSLDQKLRQVDNEFSRRQADSEESTQLNLEERMQAYQRQCDARARAETRLQVEQFKETQLTQMRLQEQEKCRLEISRARNEIDQKYRENLEALRQREQGMIERLKRQQQDQEAQLHTQRQSLLEELNVVRMREEAVKRDAELNTRAAKIEEERLHNMKEQFILKESCLETEKKQSERKCEEKLETFKKEYVEEQRKKLGNLEAKEERLKDQENRLGEEESAHRKVLEELAEQQELLSTMKLRLRNAEKENDALKQSAEQSSRRNLKMQDCESLQVQNTNLRKELNSLRDKLRETVVESEKKLSDQCELIKDLKVQVSKPSLEVQQLWYEVRQLRDAARKQQLVTDHEKQQLMSRLQHEVDCCRELRHQLDEYQLKERELRKELRDLHLLQDQTHTALEAEFQNSSRRTNRHLKSLGIGVTHHVTDSTKASQYLTHAHSPLTFQKRGQQNAPHVTNSDQSHMQRIERRVFNSSSSDVHLPPVESLAFLEQTKQTFERLENEAAELERSYQAFQQRLTQETFLSSRTMPLPQNQSFFEPPITDMDILPGDSRVEKLLADRQIASESSLSVHKVAQRPQAGSMSRVQYSGWVTRSEAEKPAATVARSAQDKSRTFENEENWKMGLSNYDKQQTLSVSSVEEGTQSSEHTVKSDIIEKPIALTATVDDNKLAATDDTIATTMEPSKNSLTTTEPQLTSSQEQCHVTVEENVTSPAVATVNLDNTWRQLNRSANKNEMNEVIISPSLENAWKSNSQTVSETVITNNQLTDTLSKAQTVEINETGDIMPAAVGLHRSGIEEENPSPNTIASHNDQRGLIEEMSMKTTEDDDWEKRRQQRAEERRQKEEAARQREKEELERLQREEQLKQRAASTEQQEQQQEEFGSNKSEREVGGKISSPTQEQNGDQSIDPTMLKYMKLISQRKEEKKVAEEAPTKRVDGNRQDEDWSLPSESHSANALASVGGGSDDDFDW